MVLTHIHRYLLLSPTYILLMKPILGEEVLTKVACHLVLVWIVHLDLRTSVTSKVLTNREVFALHRTTGDRAV